MNDAEYFADTIMNRVEHLLDERDILRRELAGKSGHDQEFVRSFQNNIVDGAAACEKIARLEHMLLIR